MKATDTAADTLTIIHRTMEALWLATAVLVPLIIAPSESMISYVQLPKVALFRTLVSLMAMLWLVEWVISSGNKGRFFNFGGFTSIKEWTLSRPTRLILVAAWAFMAVYLLSTLLSTSLSVSVWGNSSDADNYGLYNMLAYFGLFIIVATHLRTRAQLWRLLAAIAGVGFISSALGVLEYLQVIPLGEVRPANPRIASTFGNAIFFAAFLIMTIPISLAMFFNKWGKLELIDVKLKYLTIIVLIGIQVLALLLTLSRGPWVGLAVGVAAFFALGIFFLGRKFTLQAALIVLPATALAVCLMQVLPTPAERNPDDDSLRADDLGLEDRLFSIYGQVAGGGLNNRLVIWESSAQLIADRPWFASEKPQMSFIRPILGYGPALYQYVFPLEAVEFIGFQYQAHNHVIHEAVEIGFLGTSAYLILIGSIFVSGLMVLGRKDVYSLENRIIALVILVALGARFVEQLVGIAKIGDFMLFWLAAAILVSLPAADEEADSQEKVSSKASTNWFNGYSLLKIGAASIIILGLCGLIVTRNLNHVRADIYMAKAFQTTSFDEAILHTDRASELAPYSPNYYIHGNDIVRQVIGRIDTVERKAELAEKAYVNSTLALEVDPLSATARLKAANASLDLARLGYDGLAEQAIEHYQYLIDSTPHMELLHSHLWTLMAIAYLESGRPEEGMRAIERVDFEKVDADRKARALYLRGVAENQLGLTQQATLSLISSLDVNFDGDSRIKAEAHLLLSRIYEEIGQRARSQEHARLYEELAALNSG